MKKKRNPLHGWLVLDKPEGLTSTQAMGRIKRLLNPAKAGHAGTLDPLATGVLPIALGEATKTVSFALEGAKTYRFTVTWGAETTTGDADGEIVETSTLRPSAADIRAMLPRFTGAIEQVPPRFSAIKVGGQRAYDLAREGEDFDLAPRSVEVMRLDLEDQPSSDAALLLAECSKGTYVRALARDMGRALGCLGHVSALRRTRAGWFTEAEALTYEAISARLEAAAGNPAGLLQPVEAAMHGLPEMRVAPNDAARLCQGQSVLVRGRDAPLGSGMAYVTCRGQLVALVAWGQGTLQPVRIFNMT